MTNEEGGARLVTKMFGALLMVVGGLMIGLCGLCSAVFLISMAGSDPGGVGGMGIVALIFGGIPIAAGVGLFIAGRKLWRGSQSPSSPRE
ncbi:MULTISPECIES: hypothetical protein [unclassified Caulobacter]|jgi:hypothetical protein|uniref:hypothetical protein n=1 Tax=unclassified Caulobacter TaxID=2648921 RepID=UPI0006FEE885|nr:MULTISPECIES: hypothetical protein [unclassified Caulobacter]KQV57419.1 hypothetical protein ASC62_14300 [Caulobacter sp. Root342]KQV66991.1 hypothetical protein ASC70_14400 [Caulobacter sp. Root343]